MSRMTYLDHITACNTRDLSAYCPFDVDDVRLGWIKHKNLDLLTGTNSPFDVQNGIFRFKSNILSHSDRSDAAMAFTEDLASKGDVPGPRGEIYAVKTDYLAPEQFRIDRRYMRLFGLRQYGVHVNGFVHEADHISVWIGRRAQDIAVAPGQLDNMVAGGQPADLSLMENLIKEAEEEAGVSEELAQTAKPAGSISYAFDEKDGLHVSTLFIFDLKLSPAFMPENQDGEMTGFERMTVEHALQKLQEPETFKFNVNLVLIDFALRHGVLNPDEDPHYAALVGGLRQFP